MKSTSQQFRAACVISGLLAVLVGCNTTVSPLHTLTSPTAPPVVSNAGDNFQPPVVKYAVAPEFPIELRRIGATGYVTIEATIDETGRVQSPKVLESSDECLISPALHAVWRWEFHPATQNGKPVAVRTVIPIRFELAPDKRQAS
jgi:TonB family protein